MGEILPMSYIPSDSYNLSSPPFTGSPELEGRDPVEAIYLHSLYNPSDYLCILSHLVQEKDSLIMIRQGTNL